MKENRIWEQKKLRTSKYFLLWNSIISGFYEVGKWNLCDCQSIKSNWLSNIAHFFFFFWKTQDHISSRHFDTVQLNHLYAWLDWDGTQYFTQCTPWSVLSLFTQILNSKNWSKSVDYSYFFKCSILVGNEMKIWVKLTWNLYNFLVCDDDLSWLTCLYMFISAKIVLKNSGKSLQLLKHSTLAFLNIYLFYYIATHPYIQNVDAHFTYLLHLHIVGIRQ